VTPDAQLLEARAEAVLTALLQCKPLVRARSTDGAGVFKERFDQAGTLYRVGAFEEARRAFLGIAAESQDATSGPGLIATFNAAACAVAADDFAGTIDLLKPHHESGLLLGHPLWNLAISYHRLGDSSRATAALRTWALHAFPYEQARGWLAAACIAWQSKDLGAAAEFLAQARIASEEFVLDQLGVSQALVPHSAKPTHLRPRNSLSDVALNRVLRLLPAKKPERRPELAVTLSSTEIESFSAAVEAIAEGKSHQALQRLRMLQQKYSGQNHLDMALAAAELFNGNASATRSILQRLSLAGVHLTGSAYWNLARAELMLGNQPAALEALESCSKTEYLTNSTVWQAISELSGEARRQPSMGQLRRLPPIASTNKEPDLFDVRRSTLDTLIPPRRMPSSYTLDLIGLRQSDRAAIEQILKESRKLAPGEAFGILQSWISKYPTLYILKSNAAGFALQAGLISEAQNLLESAEEIRSLDRVSRLNLAHIYLLKNDFRRVGPLLDGARSSALAQTSNYWLAVAIVRTLGEHGDAADAAARALLHASDPQRRSVLDTLEKCRIVAKEGTALPNEAPVDPSVTCAREALSLLDHGNNDAATELLSAFCGPDLQEVPAIGRHILQPAFHRQLSRRLGQRVSRPFKEAVRLYQDGSYQEAAQRFEELHDEHGSEVFALDAIAANLACGRTKKAQRFSRRVLRERRTLTWQLAGNCAIAYFAGGHYARAVDILERKPNERGRRIAALTAICAWKGMEKIPALRSRLHTSIEELLTLSPKSRHLLVASALANLLQVVPDIETSRKRLLQALGESDLQTGIPAREVSSAGQLRTIFGDLKASGKRNEAIQFLRDVVETQQEDRGSEGEDLRGASLTRSLSVEVTALLSLGQEFANISDHWNAIKSLDQLELLLISNEESIQPGFLTRYWHELSLQSFKLGLSWAAGRRAERGLQIDLEAQLLKDIKSEIDSTISAPIHSRLLHDVVTLTTALGLASTSLATSATIYRQCGVLEINAPHTWSALAKLFDEQATWTDATYTEETFDEVVVAARAELPSDAVSAIESCMGGLFERFGHRARRRQVELDIYDDKVWPRSFDEEACALLVLTSSSEKALKVSVSDPELGQIIWSGTIDPGKATYARWVFQREEGFTQDEQIDLPLTLAIDDGEPEEVSITASVGSLQPSWPDYPAGSLHPSEVPEGELYGRGAFIRQRVSSFGQTRSRANYLIESVRQMGKTTLLFFLKNATPEHVLPIYIDLERLESDPNRNIWNLVIEQVLEEIGEPASEQPTNKRHSDLVKLAQRIAKTRGKNYVLLLMDELHVLLRNAQLASSVLTEFRADINQPSNCIAILFADRYTKGESAEKVPHEIWLQLSEVKLGPLDRASTEAAVTVPCRHRDADFLSETVSEIYHWTHGYPFHVQRMVQNIIERNFSGPWVTALPEDVNAVLPQMLEQDSFFREGLCRPERIDAQVQCAIATMLEFDDLCALLPDLLQDEDWKAQVASFAPRSTDFLATFSAPEQLLARLENIGLLRRSDNAPHSFEIFSPLLEKWLRRQRDHQRPLYREASTRAWGLSVNENVLQMTKENWLSLDGELIGLCRNARVTPPLKPKQYTDAWDLLVTPVNGRETFRAFSQSLQDCFVEERHDTTLSRYPWLFLATQRTRLVRNFFHHQPVRDTAQRAWKQVCLRALGGNAGADEPTNSDDWRAAQLVLLRTMEVGLLSAIATVKGMARPTM
jgi:predicted Zn-dependent protease